MYILNRQTNDVSIITGTYNNPAILSTYLCTLHKFTPLGFQLIIVNNGSHRASRELIRIYKQEVFHSNMTVLELDNSLSFSHWNNLATKYVSRKYVCYLNDDVYLSKNWLNSMVKILNRDKSIGAVSKKTLSPSGHCQWHCEGMKSGLVNDAPATCLLVRRELAEFNQKFTGYYYEDTELISRIRKSGYKVWAEREYPIVHIGKATINKLNSELHRELLERNNRILSQLKMV